MNLEPQHRYLEPGDDKKEVAIVFTLAELKQLQNMILREMDRSAEQENAIYEPQRQMAQKLEYFITEAEQVPG